MDEGIAGTNFSLLKFNLSIVQNYSSKAVQEPILFNDTIANNVKFGNPNASIEQVIEACKTANAHQFIMKTPKVNNRIQLEL